MVFDLKIDPNLLGLQRSLFHANVLFFFRVTPPKSNIDCNQNDGFEKNVFFFQL